MGSRPLVSHMLPLSSQRRLGRCQFILLGDRGAREWTSCPMLVPDIWTAGSWNRDLAVVSL